VGLLAAALYDPVWTSAVTGVTDIVIAAVALGLLVVGRAPPILVVALCAVAGQLVVR
jgi:chromate transporter